MRRAGWAALTATLLVAAVAVPLVGSMQQPDERVGDPVTALPSPTTSSPTTSSPSTAATRDVDPAAGRGVLPLLTARPAAPGEAGETAAVVPQRLRVPGLDVDAEVVPVGVSDDGAMQIPRDGATVGWYEYGSAPGDPAGSAVLAGHVDTRADGPGALFEARSLDVGDQLVVTGDDGRDLEYRVTGRDSIVKAALPVDELFTREGPPRLVLITCGGDFLPELRSYSDNVVVVAEPVR